MLRRNPTRIELKLDDISEFNEMREELLKKELKINIQNIASTSTMTTAKSRQEIHDRLGYVPHPRQAA